MKRKVKISMVFGLAIIILFMGISMKIMMNPLKLTNIDMSQNTAFAPTSIEEYSQIYNYSSTEGSGILSGEERVIRPLAFRTFNQFTKNIRKEKGITIEHEQFILYAEFKPFIYGGIFETDNNFHTIKIVIYNKTSEDLSIDFSNLTLQTNTKEYSIDDEAMLTPKKIVLPPKKLIVAGYEFKTESITEIKDVIFPFENNQFSLVGSFEDNGTISTTNKTEDYKIKCRPSLGCQYTIE